MKTLVIDCRMARMSGIGVYLRNLAPRCMELLSDAARFRLLGYNGAFPVPKSAVWEATPCSAPVYSIAEQFRLPPLLRGCDALWLSHYPVPMFAGIPLAVTVHDVAHLALTDLFKGAQRAYARFMFQIVRRKAAELLFVSDFSRKEFLRLVGKPRGTMHVALNGVDHSWLEQPLEPAAAPPYLLAVGNIKPHKNIRLLCRAFAAIADNCAANLILVGEYSGFRSAEAPTETLAAACPGRITFAGPVDQQELVRLMRGATALVFPSRYEGFGLPPLEALAAGIPVVASDIPPVREVCGAHAAYFPPDNERLLAQRLLEICNLSPVERQARGAAGREHAARFTWEKAAAATTQALRRALRLES